MAVASFGLFAVDHPAVSAVSSILVVAALTVSAVPFRVVRRLAVPIVVTVLLLVVAQYLFGDLERGIAAGIRLLALGLLGVAFTVTTRGTDVVAWVERALVHLRLRSDTVFRMGLMVGVTTRSVEHLAVTGQRVLDARRARGLTRNVRALAVPLVVEAARFAHGVGDALDARGVSTPQAEVTDPVGAPYMLVRDVRVRGRTARAVWTPRGDELGPAAGSRADRVPGTLLLEAAAQAAGRLLAHHHPGSRWLLTGVDAFTVEPASWHRPLTITAAIDRDSRQGARIVLRIRDDDRRIGEGRLLMTTLPDPEASR